MSKRITAIITALLLIFLCGCGEERKADMPAEASEVTVRFFSTLGDAADSGITGRILSDFTSENSYITLYYTSVAAADVYKLSLPDGATYRQNSPDIVYAPLYAVSSLLGEEYVSIDELRSHDSRYASDIAEYALLRDSSGTAYGAAVRGEGSILAVNTDLAGNSRDLHDIARNLSDSDVFLFADNALDSGLFFDYLMTVYTDSVIDAADPQTHWLNGFELFSELVRMGAFAPSDSKPFELFSQNKAVFAVLTEAEAALLSGENYQCAAFFGDFSEGIFITRSALSSPLKRKAVLELAAMLMEEKSSYAEGKIRADGTGVFFSLGDAYPIASNEEKYGVGCWDEVLKGLTRGDEPKSVLDRLINAHLSASDLH